jgi:hypothetical protein
LPYTSKDLFAAHTAACKKALALCALKNHDYAGSEGSSPFANFERSEALGLGSTEQGILIRMSDKISRLAEFCRAGVLKVSTESVEDTCLDIINYAILFQEYRRKKAMDREVYLEPSAPPVADNDGDWAPKPRDYTQIVVERPMVGIKSFGGVL